MIPIRRGYFFNKVDFFQDRENQKSFGFLYAENDIQLHKISVLLHLGLGVRTVLRGCGI